jgi:hypothetical protein
MPLYRIGICELTWFLVPLQCKYPSWTEWRDFDLKRMLDNVGLPDKSHVQPLDRLPMPPRIHAIPPLTKVLGADRTPDLARLMPLFLLLFSLIFTASKA